MQEALTEMNLQLHHVVSDITGVTGRKINRAIVAGERDLDVLAAYRDVRCKASTKTIIAALNGNDRPEHIFGLTQSLELYDFYQVKMLECDRYLEATLAALAADTEHDASRLPRPRTKTKQVSTPSFDVRAALFGLLGVDLTQIPGMGRLCQLNWLANVALTFARGRAPNTSRRGSAWHRGTRYLAVRCCHLERGDHQAVLRPCYA